MNLLTILSNLLLAHASELVTNSKNLLLAHASEQKLSLFIILKEYENNLSISENLVTKAIEYGKSKGLTRVELNFMEHEEKVDYQTLGMPVTDRNSHMRQELTQKTTYTECFENSEIIPINQSFNFCLND